MKKITLEKIKVDPKKYLGKKAQAEGMLISEDAVIHDRATGKPVIYYRKIAGAAGIVESLKKIKYQESDRTSGMRTRSRIFGYAPRIPLRNDYCHKASLAETHPEEHRVIIDFAERVAEIYAETFPDTYKKNMEVLKKVLPEWQIEGTPFTSGIVNQDNPLPYHYDSGNFKGVMSNMIAFKKDCHGGHLHIPEYKCILEIDDCTLTIFDGQALLHGVTPFKILTGGHRFTAVYYCLEQMWKCLTAAEEITRFRQLNQPTEKTLHAKR